MDTNPKPLNVAARTLITCLACCVMVIALFFLFGDTDKARNPVRLGMMLLVLVAVPLGNYFAVKRRRRNAE
jgi:uncharacterized membrane protein